MFLCELKNGHCNPYITNQNSTLQGFWNCNENDEAKNYYILYIKCVACKLNDLINIVA